MTTEEVIQAVCAFCESAAGLSFGDARPADSGDVRPGSPFLSVSVVSDGVVGRPEALHGLVAIEDVATNVEQVRSRRDVRVSINGYGHATRAWLETIADAWIARRPGSAGQVLREAGVKVRSATPIQNRSALLQTAIEPRWGLDLLAYVDREGTVSPSVDGAASVVVDVAVSRESGVILTTHAEVNEP